MNLNLERTSPEKNMGVIISMALSGYVIVAICTYFVQVLLITIISHRLPLTVIDFVELINIPNLIGMWAIPFWASEFDGRYNDMKKISAEGIWMGYDNWGDTLIFTCLCRQVSKLSLVYVKIYIIIPSVLTQTGPFNLRSQTGSIKIYGLDWYKICLYKWSLISL